MKNCIKIDEVDVQILKTLLKDARTSFAILAKRTGKSTNTIRMRYNNLKKNGVIKGAFVHVNPLAIGYEGIGSIQIQTDSNMGKDFFEYLQTIPNILFWHKQIYNFNIVAFFVLEKITDVDNLMKKISLHPNVVQANSALWSDTSSIDNLENLNIEPVENVEYSKIPLGKNEKKVQNIKKINDGKKRAKTTLNKNDLLILNALTKDARISFRKISYQTGISTQTVIQRYKNLKRKKVIVYTSISLDLKKIGYIGNALFAITISSQLKKSKIIAAINQIPDVISTNQLLGRLVILVLFVFKDISQVMAAYEKIKRVSGVLNLYLVISEPFPSWPLDLYSKLIY